VATDIAISSPGQALRFSELGHISQAITVTASTTHSELAAQIGTVRELAAG